jgi:hypothetical protein
MAWFRMLYSKNAFERSLGKRKVLDLSPAEGLRAMAAFYRDHRPQHAPAEDGDDVLEFRWAPNAGGYELAIMRRMRRHGDGHAPERTLELAYRFRMTGQREAVRAGQHALDDPNAANEFVRRMTASAPWKVVSGAAVTQRTLTEA